MPISTNGNVECGLLSMRIFVCRACIVFLKGDFFGFFLFKFDIQHCFICRPSGSTVSEDAGIEPRTVFATTALAVRRSNHSAWSHPHSARSHPHSAILYFLMLEKTFFLHFSFVIPYYECNSLTKDPSVNLISVVQQRVLGLYIIWSRSRDLLYGRHSPSIWLPSKRDLHRVLDRYLILGPSMRQAGALTLGFGSSPTWLLSNEFSAEFWDEIWSRDLPCGGQAR